MAVNFTQISGLCMGRLGLTSKGVRVPRCDCRCAPLTVTAHVSTRTVTRVKGGFTDFYESGNLAAYPSKSSDGQQYLTRTLTLQKADGRQYTLTATMDPVAGTSTFECDPPGGFSDFPKDDDGQSVYTHPYTDEAFFGDLNDRLAALPWTGDAGGDIAHKTGNGEAIAIDGANARTITLTVNRPLVSTGSLQSANYKLRVNFAHPWISGRIKIRWRERTANQSGSHTVYSTGSPQYQQTGVVTYVAKEEIIAPAAGATYAETAAHVVEGRSLALGDSVTLVGPPLDDEAAAGLSASFYIGVKRAAAAKYGALPYQVDGGSVAVPRYKTETASTAAGSVVSYGGVATASEAGPQEDDIDFGASVPADYYTMGDGAGPIDHMGEVAELTSAKVRYRNGLILQLSDECTTTSLTDAVESQLESAIYSYQTSEGGSIARRDFADDESYYVLAQGRYGFAYGALQCDTGLPTLWPGTSSVNPALYSGTISVQGVRSVLDLTTGGWSSSPVEGSLHFSSSDGINGRVGGWEFSAGDSSQDGIGTSPANMADEPPPATNQIVHLHGAKYADASDHVIIPFLAEIIG